MKKYLNQETFTSILMVTIGSFIFSFMINAVVIPNQFREWWCNGNYFVTILYIWH